MSEDNLWGEDNFLDMPDEVQLDSNGLPRQAPPAQIKTQRSSVPAPKPIEPPPIEEEAIEEAIEEIEEDFSDVFSDANLRLEQGSLWKMIMKHDLFEGVDADPKAIQNVQKAIRKFAKEQMEIMLGMRRETATIENLHIDFPFNTVEVEVLKLLAHKASGGRSENSDSYVPAIVRTTEEIEATPAKRKTINPIGPSNKKVSAPSKPLPKKAAAPIKRTKMDLTIDQIAAEEGVPRELLEEHVGDLGGKKIHEMTEDEILERNRLVSQRRGAKAKPKTAMPMPSYEQQEMIAMTKAAQASGNPLSAKIIEAAKKMGPTKFNNE